MVKTLNQEGQKKLSSFFKIPNESEKKEKKQEPRREQNVEPSSSASLLTYNERRFEVANFLCPVCDSSITLEEHISRGGGHKIPIHITKEGFYISDSCPIYMIQKLKKLIKLMKGELCQ